MSDSEAHRIGFGPFEQRGRSFTLARRSEGQISVIRPDNRREVSISKRSSSPDRALLLCPVCHQPVIRRGDALTDHWDRSLAILAYYARSALDLGTRPTTPLIAIRMQRWRNPWVHGKAADPFVALIIVLFVCAIAALIAALA